MKKIMKIGLLCNFYGFPENTIPVLQPWLKFDCLKIAVSSFKYPEYAKFGWDVNDRETSKILLDIPEIDFLAYGKNGNDSFSRNTPLQYLKEEGVDYIWLLDQDEFYTENEIKEVLNYLQNNDFPYYKINFKNFVGSRDFYINGFCPPRIFKNKIEKMSLELHSFYYENDVCYLHRLENKLIDYKLLPFCEIPLDKCNPLHYSWCGDASFLKAKIEYQKNRYGGICSYDWDDEKGLIFNEDYYQGKEKPKLLKL